MSLAFLGVNPVAAIIATASIVVLIGLLVWGAWNPLVWRILSVLGMGAGAGLLVWGILLASMKQPPPAGLPGPAAIIALGAGVLASAITLLVISFCGRCAGRKG